MLKIGDFSKLSRISIRMLRNYDEIGLLVPDNIDELTGYRYYNATQLPLANKINALKNMGFGLSTITSILKEYGDTEALKKYLTLKYAEIKEQSQNTHKQLLLLETTIHRLGKDRNMMNHTVILKEMPQRTVASLRNVIPSYDREGMLWEQMMQETAPLNMQMAPLCNALAVFHDKGYKESDVDVEIQITVVGEYNNTEHVIFKNVKPILMASATYKGSYELISDVNEAVANWVTDNRYEFDGPMFNICHVGPATESNPNNWVTEVCYPVKKN